VIQETLPDFRAYLEWVKTNWGQRRNRRHIVCQ
jgi:hypothetical protein